MRIKRKVKRFGNSSHVILTKDFEPDSTVWITTENSTTATAKDYELGTEFKTQYDVIIEKLDLIIELIQKAIGQY